jgi:hypothetical protein
MSENELDEIKGQVLKQLTGPKKTRTELVEIVAGASRSLTRKGYTRERQRTFFGDLITEAQDNTATMANAGEAQEIINQLLGR